MSLRFILGRAGTGKTHYITETLKEILEKCPDGPPLIILVPEQSSFQMEYTLATQGLNGSIRAQVLSFRRLAHRVLLETGGAARIPIGETGKRMVLRELLERHKNSLRVFAKSADRPGFTDSLARSIGEFKTYLVYPEDLNKVCSSIGENFDLLKDKLSDLALLYAELEKYLAANYTDPDDYLTLLAQKVTNSKFLNGAAVWIDGFKGFTPQEYEVIENLFRVCESVDISLCLDPNCSKTDLNDSHVFYATWETYQKLKKIAAETGTLLLEPIELSDKPAPRFANCPELMFLEKNYFTYPAPDYTDNPDNVKIAAAANKRAEVEACARKIISLVREKGYHWRDMAVLVRDIEPYWEIINAVFQDYNIPCFIDRKRSVLHHPLVELIRSALEAIDSEWSYQSVFRYLKTDMAPVGREEIFKLENYVLEHGIRGRKWLDNSDWGYRRRYTLGEDNEIEDIELKELAEINAIRRLAVKELASFQSNVKQAKNVSGVTKALYSLLEELMVPATLEKWSREAEQKGQLDKARENAQIWSGIVDLFEELAESLGDENLSLTAYRSILDAGFENMTLGLVPPGLDQVVVGTLDRSRSPEIKALFVLGANEGIFPARISEQGIFNDDERERISSLGLELGPGTRKKAFEEQFFIYTALTRASQLLWLSYSLADDEGRSLGPSPVVARIKKLFPLVAEYTYQVDPDPCSDESSLEYLADYKQSFNFLSAKMREARQGLHVSQVWWEFYNWLLSHNKTDQLKKICKAVFHQNKELPIKSCTSRQLYGNPLRASVSRIEKFISCPFAHFTSYGLKLHERRVYTLAAPDMGEFFHASLKCFAEELKCESIKWAKLDKDKCSAIMSAIVDKLAPQLQSEILLSSSRYRYITGKLKRIVTRAAVVLSEHARRSKFEPVGIELSFGPGGQISPLKIELPDGNFMELAGRIDRLDVAATPEGLYLRVLDYKSSDQSIKIQEVMYGLKLQLLTYLHVALEYYAEIFGQPGIPAGILYFTVKEPIINGSGPMEQEEIEKSILSELKMKGFLLADPKVIKLMDDKIDKGYSELLPVGIKTDGTFYSNSSVVGPDRFAILGNYLENVYMEAGKEIVDGKVSIEPFSYKTKNACQFCEYKPVCKFDEMIEGNQYRKLPKISEEDAWIQIEVRRSLNERPEMD